ncbi:hypothetical protein MKX34_03075 [Paenibacillus sp. FSL R5-0636]|uniref:hypothetical protein n=1 Tax=Paenibacillus TaxID=44249 RepID=UPI000AABEEDA|nr:hypothetical protein [Paenibacillus odorifer]
MPEKMPSYPSIVILYRFGIFFLPQKEPLKGDNTKEFTGILGFTYLLGEMQAEFLFLSY